jgi:hypothetical protein
MTRITESDIWRVLVPINNKLTGNRKLTVEWAYGKPRAYEVDDRTPNVQKREVSPRLTKPQMYDWLCGFEEALDFAENPNYDERGRISK